MASANPSLTVKPPAIGRMLPPAPPRQLAGATCRHRSGLETPVSSRYSAPMLTARGSAAVGSLMTLIGPPTEPETIDCVYFWFRKATADE
jgi:hypothetical protein